MEVSKVNKATKNPDGWGGRYVIGCAVVGQLGLAELDDGTMLLVFIQSGGKKFRPQVVRKGRPSEHQNL